MANVVLSGMRSRLDRHSRERGNPLAPSSSSDRLVDARLRGHGEGGESSMGGRGSRRAAVVLPLLLTFLLQTAQAGALYRPSQQQRTVTASTYQVSIQKNGRADITLLNGERVFLNAFPAVLFESDEEWTELDISSRYTFREQVNDALGQGQAIMMAKGNCEWAIRTYSTQPFFTVQAVFINTTKKSVRVRAVSPWRTADTRKPGGVWLGKEGESNRALVLQEAPRDFVSTRLASDWPAESSWHIALHNLESGRSLIAGTLGLTEYRSTFTASEHAEDVEKGLLRFEHAITFADPVEVKPNERLTMPIAYFAISEEDPLLGLRRYGEALARVNGVSTEPSPEISRAAAQFFSGNKSGRANLQPNAPNSWQDAGEALTNAARLAHLTPYFWQPDVAQGRYTIPNATESQQRAWLTGLAFAGSTLSGDDPALARLTPMPRRAATPIDLFRHERPSIWALPMDNEGAHTVVALFNWDGGTPETIEIDFAELGLARNAYYTVYDAWPRQYMGTAAESLRVAVLPGSVRVLSLRRHWDDPVVLAIGDHITTASSQEDEWNWDATTNTLSGKLQPTDANSIRIDILVPERFSRFVSKGNGVVAELQPGHRVVTLSVPGPPQSVAEWNVRFE